MFITPRELVRRWYSQIKNQPKEIASQLTDVIAHSIIPSTSQVAFLKNDIVPLSQVIDLVTHTELNSTNEIVGSIVRGYKASYDKDTNQVTLGGSNNFLFEKDVFRRPFKGANRRIIDSDQEISLLLAVLEMESERETSLKYDNIRQPSFPQFLLSFNDGNEPTYQETAGLKQLAFEHLFYDAPGTKNYQAPEGYRGVVENIMKDYGTGMLLVELSECENVIPMDLVFEAPIWAESLVKIGDEISSCQPLIKVSLPEETLEALDENHDSIHALWDEIKSMISDNDAHMLLKNIWESEQFAWTNMTMLPTHLVTPQDASKASGIWRDLRGNLLRTCHDFENPNRIMRVGQREGKINLWHKDYGLKMHTIFGEVDLQSHKFSYKKIA